MQRIPGNVASVCQRMCTSGMIVATKVLGLISRRSVTAAGRNKQTNTQRLRRLAWRQAVIGTDVEEAPVTPVGAVQAGSALCSPLQFLENISSCLSRNVLPLTS